MNELSAFDLNVLAYVLRSTDLGQRLHVSDIGNRFGDREKAWESLKKLQEAELVAVTRQDSPRVLPTCSVTLFR